jgi:hypothetical protein
MPKISIGSFADSIRVQAKMTKERRQMLLKNHRELFERAQVKLQRQQRAEKDETLIDIGRYERNMRRCDAVSKAIEQDGKTIDACERLEGLADDLVNLFNSVDTNSLSAAEAAMFRDWFSLPDSPCDADSKA